MEVDKSQIALERNWWRDYIELCKPRVVGLIVFTAIIGMLLASPGMVSLSILIPASLGILLSAASAAAINHVAEYRIDALMSRTQNRPLPQGGVTRRNALIFSLVVGGVGMGFLFAFVNVITAVLTFVSLIGYAVIYTMYLKYATPQNIVIGGAAGAAPPVLGWSSVTGTVEPESLLLFLMIFAWTPPHFWALAIYRRDDYAKAAIPMLPITHGVEYTRKQILIYTLLLVVTTLIPYAAYMAGETYLLGVLLLNSGFLYYVVRMQFDHSEILAFKTFKFSIVYLGLLFLLLFVDHYSLLNKTVSYLG
ncbi:MAG: heme o synthase [Pseudomonadota bacterium]|nr:heme o synthase [Pseudomonadota bacterium]